MLLQRSAMTKTMTLMWVKERRRHSLVIGGHILKETLSNRAKSAVYTRSQGRWRRKEIPSHITLGPCVLGGAVFTSAMIMCEPGERQKEVRKNFRLLFPDMYLDKKRTKKGDCNSVIGDWLAEAIANL